MKTKNKIFSLFFSFILFTTQVIQVQAWVWYSWWWSSEWVWSYIIQNSKNTEWWNDKFKTFIDQYYEFSMPSLEKLVKAQLEKWWITKTDIIYYWWKTKTYELEDWEVNLKSTKKVEITSNLNWDITITPPQNDSNKHLWRYSYTITWWKSTLMELWDLTTWIKTYSKLYNESNKWKKIVFRMTDPSWNTSYLISKLWWSASDLENISSNSINDVYEMMDNWLVSIEQPLLQVTKIFDDKNSDWKLTCTWIPWDLNCTPDAWEKVKFVFKSLNTTKWWKISIKNFSLKLTWINSENFETLLNSCNWKTEIKSWESCVIEYAVKSWINWLNKNKTLSAILDLKWTASILFEWNKYDNVKSFNLNWEVTWFCNYVAPTTDWSFACLWTEWFLVPNYNVLDYNQINYNKTALNSIDKSKFKYYKNWYFVVDDWGVWKKWDKNEWLGLNRSVYFSYPKVNWRYLYWNNSTAKAYCKLKWGVLKSFKGPKKDLHVSWREWDHFSSYEWGYPKMRTITDLYCNMEDSTGSPIWYKSRDLALK